MLSLLAWQSKEPCLLAMANRTLRFPPPTASSDEEGAFRPDLFVLAESGVMDSSFKFLDPELQNLSPPAPYPRCEVPPQPVQWYLNDHHKTAFFNADPPSKMHPNRALARPPVMRIPPVHTPSHARLASPSSSHEPSSISGSTRSPPADTESYCDNAFPTTPSDTATLLSPFIQPLQLYEFMTPHDALPFANMGPSQPSNNAYVNPVDVHASHHHIESFFDAEESIDFSLQPQSSSFSFDPAYDPTTPFDLEPLAAEEEEQQHQHQHQQHQIQVFAEGAPRARVASTSADHTIIKDEIEAVSQYPDPSPTQADLDEDDEEEPIFELPRNKRKSAADEAFQPTSSKRARGGAATKPPPPALSVRGSARRSTTAAAKQTASRRSPTGDAVAIKQKPKMATPSAPGLATTTLTTKQGGPFPCPECPQNSFKDQLSLDNHIKKQHTRAYHCVFHFAGCTSTFANKNEWKRHVASKHLLLQYWLCQEGSCARASNSSPEASPAPPAAKNRSRSFRTSAAPAAAAAVAVVATASASLDPPLPNGAIFNRRDLYTQHLRRMHMPPNMKKQAKQQSRKNGGSGSNSTTVGLVPEWEERLRAMASRAIRTRCMVPIFMRCPALHCDAEFSGSEAWDQRMEHVGRHLEHAAAHEEPRIEFGGADDTTLIDWASRPDVAVIRWNAGRWELNNPLKASEKTPAVAGASILAIDPAMTAPGYLAPLGEDPMVQDEIVVDHGSDQDAEGEEDY